MKHYSGIDYEHFLDDIRDMYPFSVEEAVLVELIANALDAKTSLIDVRIDASQGLFQLTDNGHGMDAKEFETYHNFSTSFKRKGQGIGFAGLGAKLALRIAERIVTETRSRKFWGASEWKFERKRKTTHPVWYDLPERTLPHEGTRVTIHLKHRSRELLSIDAARETILAHYVPLLVVKEFYQTVRLYRPITVLLNGELLEAPVQAPEKFKQYILRRGRSRKPFALARFELHTAPVPEPVQGIAIATFGKIIKRDWLKQHVKEMDRITGIIEVPELVECLTTSKCDFRRDGTAGNRYYRFNKAAQQEFRRWLEEIHLLEKQEANADKDVQRLQRLVNHIVAEIPDLQQFYGSRADHMGLVKETGGDARGALPQSLRGNGDGAEAASHIETAAREAAEAGISLDEGGEFPAVRRLRDAKSGPVIRYVHSPNRPDISWMEGDTVLINTAHATYSKAVEKRVLEYHNLFAVALAMLREVPSAQEKLSLLEQFMSEWGKV
jgi:hypothetical protein